ncbi:MAG TPA: hypothetical protein VGB19_04390 [Actinomycetota bacterium]
MADPPRSPESESGVPPDRDGAARNRPRRALVLAVVAAVALIALLIFLHLSGAVGPGAH